MIYLSLNSDFMFLLDFVVAKFCRIFTCCFSVVMYHTCGQLCCVEHVCDLNGTLKWNAQHKDLTEWKNYIQQEFLERTISDEHWTQMAMRNLRWFQKNIMVVKECYLRWSWRTLPLRWSWKKLPFDAHEMNIASGCPRIRHLVRWYLPRLHSLSPGLPCSCVGQLHMNSHDTWGVTPAVWWLQRGLWFASVDVSVFIRCVFLGTEPTVW